jgi:hypothetical protein
MCRYSSSKETERQVQVGGPGCEFLTKMGHGGQSWVDPFRDIDKSSL